NLTIDHIIKQSPLIEVFRHCRVIVENVFHLLHHTIRHQPPDITKTIEKLTKRLLETKPHKFTARHKLQFSVDDKVASGFGIIEKKGLGVSTSGEGNSESVEITGADLVD
ncbi:hypothetical protein SERLADRAFT_353396, partial [Serpula lacrymans var. lacrymans S7.9]